MPNIPEYFAPGAMSIIHPSETGEQALVRAGRFVEETATRTGQMYAKAIAAPGLAAVKIADDFTYQHDNLKQDAALVTLQNQALEKYKQDSATWDPNDLSAPQKWKQQNWDATQDKFMQGYTNRRAAQRGEEMWARANEHMQNIITSDVSLRAGKATVLNAENVVQGLSTRVGNDVSSLSNAHDTLDATVKMLSASPALDAEGRASLAEGAVKWHQELDKSALEGMLVSNPGGAEKLASQGYFKTLPGGQVAQAIQRAQTMQQEGALRGMEMKRIQQEQSSKDTLAGLLQQHLVKLPNGDLKVDEGFTSNFLGSVKKMQPAQLTEGMQILSASNSDTQRAWDHPEAVHDAEIAAISGDPQAEYKIRLAAATKQLKPETADMWLGVVKSPFAENLKDTIVHQAYDQAEKLVGQAIAGPTWGMINQMQKTGDVAATQAAMLHITGQLATMTKPEIMRALDPSDPKSLVNPLALAQFKNLVPMFNKLYPDNGGVSPNNTGAGSGNSALPSISLFPSKP